MYSWNIFEERNKTVDARLSTYRHTFINKSVSDIFVHRSYETNLSKKKKKKKEERALEIDIVWNEEKWTKPNETKQRPIKKKKRRKRKKKKDISSRFYL